MKRFVSLVIGVLAFLVAQDAHAQLNGPLQKCSGTQTTPSAPFWNFKVAGGAALSCAYNAATASDEVTLTAAAGSITLATAYNNGAAAADQTLLIQAGKGGPVIAKANAAATGSLFQAQTSTAGVIENLTDNGQLTWMSQQAANANFAEMHDTTNLFTAGTPFQWQTGGNALIDFFANGPGTYIEYFRSDTGANTGYVNVDGVVGMRFYAFGRPIGPAVAGDPLGGPSGGVGQPWGTISTSTGIQGVTNDISILATAAKAINMTAHAASLWQSDGGNVTINGQSGGGAGIALQSQGATLIDVGVTNAGVSMAAQKLFLLGAFTTLQLPGTCTDGQLVWDSTTTTVKRCKTNAFASLLTSADWTFGAFTSGNIAGNTAFAQTITTNAATLESARTAVNVVGVGGGNFVVKLCDSANCGTSTYATCTAACTAAVGTVTSCVINTPTVLAAAPLVWTVATACGSTDPAINATAHLTQP